MLLVRDRDASLAALAAYHALELGFDHLRGEIDDAVEDRPSLMEMAGGPLRPPEPEAGDAS
jgi:hypothetical protein